MTVATDGYAAHRVIIAFSEALVSQKGIEERIMAQRVGEVIGADSRALTVQCYELYGAPPLGTFLSIGEPPVLAIVQCIRTEPLDPSRPVLARGRDANTLDEIYRENPQLERLLTTRLEALIVGYESSGRLVQLLPPVPPAIHAFVSICPPDTVARFTDNLEFTRFLLNSGSPMADEVMVACLRTVTSSRGEGDEFLRQAGQILSKEMVGDSARLSSILRRARL